MCKFVYFTSAEKRQANEVDLPSFLLDRGEKLIMAGRDYRLASDHSITVRGPMWYDHAARKGGRAISFVQQFYDKTYPEAVTMLLGTVRASSPSSRKSRSRESRSPSRCRRPISICGGSMPT